jgi:hypothetical protein
MPLPFDGKGPWRPMIGQWSDVDKESVSWQFATLLQKPNTAFRYFSSRRHERGMWARGHIRFALFEAIAILLLSLLWYLFPEFHFSWHSIVANFFTFIVRDFFISGLALSFLVCTLLNRCGLAMRSYRESHQDVERRFVFDAFCNGVVAVIVDFMAGYFIVHIFERWFRANRIFQLLVPNTLFLGTFVHFIYLFVGTLNILPFIKRVPTLPFALPALGVYVLSLVFGWQLPFKCVASHFT